MKKIIIDLTNDCYDGKDDDIVACEFIIENLVDELINDNENKQNKVDENEEDKADDDDTIVIPSSRDIIFEQMGISASDLIDLNNDEKEEMLASLRWEGNLHYFMAR